MIMSVTITNIVVATHCYRTLWVFTVGYSK